MHSRLDEPLSSFCNSSSQLQFRHFVLRDSDQLDQSVFRRCQQESHMNRQTKKQVKVLRPHLRQDCLQRLATLMRKCWAGNSHDRPLFPELRRGPRHIKGLLLKVDSGLTNLFKSTLQYAAGLFYEQHLAMQILTLLLIWDLINLL